MTGSKTLKLLLIEDDLEDEQILSEALIEIEEQRQWCNWRTASIIHVETLEDALHCLGQETFDTILLNLSLPDSPALLDSFAEVSAAARETPIVILADEPDENLAHRLLREGAQDVLVKSELDCGPLARALRYSIERQRRCSPFNDGLTGTLTPAAFETLSSYYQHLDTPLVTASLEFEGLDRDTRDLTLIQAAEILRGTFESPALISRTNSAFQILTAGFNATTVETLLHVAARKIEQATEHKPNFSIAVVEPAILTT